MDNQRPPSNTLVDKAGETLRQFTRQHDVDADEVRRALDVVTRFRATWAAPPQPLAKVRGGLSSMTGTVVRGKAKVSQRLKRLHRIVEKLSREEHRTMRLSQMEDVGGCRVVVPSLAELRRVRERIVGKWADQVRDERDYVERPKSDGYRAVHLVIERDGRLVEIQLRTQLQHLWAAHVEKLETTRGEVLRRGLGEEHARITLRAMADGFARWDAHQEFSLEAIFGMLAVWVAQLEERR